MLFLFLSIKWSKEVKVAAWVKIFWNLEGLQKQVQSTRRRGITMTIWEKRIPAKKKAATTVPQKLQDTFQGRRRRIGHINWCLTGQVRWKQTTRCWTLITVIRILQQSVCVCVCRWEWERREERSCVQTTLWKSFTGKRSSKVRERVPGRVLKLVKEGLTSHAGAVCNGSEKGRMRCVCWGRKPKGTGQGGRSTWQLRVPKHNSGTRQQGMSVKS